MIRHRSSESQIVRPGFVRERAGSAGEEEYVNPYANLYELPGLVDLWDAADIEGIVPDESPLDSFGWPSNIPGSENDRRLENNLGELGPTYQATGGSNAQPAVFFNGSMHLNPAFNISEIASDYTIYFVGKQGGTGTRILLSCQDSDAQSFTIRQSTSANLTGYLTGATSVTCEAAVTGVDAIWGFSLTSGAPRVRINRTEKTLSDTTFTATKLDNITIIGANPAASASFWSGYICLIAIYNQAHTQAQMIGVEEILGTRFGL